MKKNLILAVILGLGLTFNANLSNAADQTQTPTAQKPPCTECPPSQFNKHHPCPPKNFKDGKMKPPHQDLDSKLKLTEEQQTKAREIRMQGRDEIKPIMEQLHAKREKIREIKESNASDKSKEKQIAKQREEIKQLRQKADAIREKNMAQFEAILTPEQKAEFDQFKKEMKAKREQFKKEMMQKKQQRMLQQAPNQNK